MSKSLETVSVSVSPTLNCWIGNSLAILRFLVEGAINSRFAALFGGKFSNSSEDKKRSSRSQTSLLEENYKYGSMPTHPLGAAVAFHSGTIGKVSS